MPIESQSERARYHDLLRRRVKASFAIGLLGLGGCGVFPGKSYLTDTTHVQCDGQQTVSPLSDQYPSATFHMTQADKTRLTVTIGYVNLYEYTLDVDHADDVRVGVLPLADSQYSGETDYIINTTNGRWDIDVRPDEQDVLIKGICEPPKTNTLQA